MEEAVITSKLKMFYIILNYRCSDEDLTFGQVIFFPHFLVDPGIDVFFRTIFAHHSVQHQAERPRCRRQRVILVCFKLLWTPDILCA